MSGGASACWPWLASVERKRGGYGKCWIPKEERSGGRLEKSHRVAFFLLFGTLPGKLLRHFVCDNPPCCNPYHARPGSSADNNHDMSLKRRNQSGDQHWSRRTPERLPWGERNSSRKRPERVARGEKTVAAKLTEECVLSIRKRYRDGSADQPTLAAEYGVHQVTISLIVLRKRWKHLAEAK